MPVSVNLPEGMREELELRKKEKHYSSMSEVIRDALTQFLEKEEGLNKKEEAALKLIREDRFKKLELEGEKQESMEKSLKQLQEHRK